MLISAHWYLEHEGYLSIVNVKKDI
jgi:hypothetical protein